MSNPIGWTDQTWNPVVGCSHVSPACDHCYAEAMAKRLVGQGVYPGKILEWPPEGRPYPALGWSGKVATFPDKLDQPLHWRKPRRVFVVSMGDLFHEDVPLAFIERVLAVMRDAAQHTFQVLTKRPERMRDLLGSSRYDHHLYLPNVWLGVTAEDQQRADERIPVLLDTPAAVRFVSVEPMLGPVDLTRVDPWGGWTNALAGRYYGETANLGVTTYLGEGPKLDWVIAGGESGPGARPSDPAWFRSLHDQCADAGVPFYLKDRPGTIDGIAYREFPS